jgi:hypothetical protein
MLSDSRNFKAKGNSLKELKLHVRARQSVMKASGSASWIFGADSGFNSKYWVNELVPKGDASDAVNDLFSQNAKLYTRGCQQSSRMIMLKGILDAIGDSAFDKILDPKISEGAFLDSAAISAGLLRVVDVGHTQKAGETPRDWVPGDIGYFQGKSEDSLIAGQWVIYRGQGVYYGYASTPAIHNFETWISIVTQWAQAESPGFKAFTDPKRLFPGVGLE